MRFLACLLLFSALCAFAPLRALFPCAQAQERTVGRILLESDGPLTRLSPADCLKLIQLRQGQPYSASAVKHSIERLYATQAFFDIQVHIQDSADGQVDVVFRLTRLYRIRRLRMVGDLRLERAELHNRMAIRSQTAYSDRLVEQGLERLKEFYRRHGYYQAHFSTESRLDEKNAELQLTVQVEAGLQARVASLQVQAEGQIGQARVRRHIALRMGQAYSQDALKRSLQSLQEEMALQGFVNVRAEVVSEKYDPVANQVHLTVEVDSGPRRQLEIRGAKLSRRELLQLPVFRFRSLSPALADETEASLIEMHEDKGYFHVEVTRQSVPAASGGPGLIFEVVPGQKAKLSSILFEGNQSVSSDFLQRLIRVRPAGIFGRGRYSRRMAEQDLESIRSHYGSQGFGAEVSWELRVNEINPQLLTLAYQINEGLRSSVRSLVIKGNQVLATDRLLPLIDSVPGQPYSSFQAVQDCRELMAAYEDLGYRQVECRFEASPEQDGPRDLTFEIEEGRQTFVDDVLIVGDLRTRLPVIQEQLRIQPGDPLSLRSALQTETNLHNLAIFDRVDLEEVETSDRPDARTVVIRLREAPRFTFLYGIGYSSFEGPRGTVGLTDNNFRGRAQVLALGLRASQSRQRANLSWTVPRVRQLELPTVFSLTALNQDARTGQEGNINTLQGRPFDELRWTFSGRSERPLSRRESLFFGLRFERVEIDLPVGFEEETRLEFFRQEESLRLSALELSYINESRDVPSDPRQGFFLAGDTSLSSRIVGSEEEFFRILLQGSYYRPLPKRVVLASALRMGWLRPFGRTQSVDESNPVPISERFFAGGSTSLRGLPQDMAGPLLEDASGNPVLVDDEGREAGDGRPVALGGNALLVANIELRVPVWKSLWGTLFYDAGNVFNNFSSIKLSEFSNTFGLGARVRTPVGPIRIDAGYNPDPPDAPGFRNWLFHISLGHAF